MCVEYMITESEVAMTGQGSDEADLALLVDRFYAKVREDSLIGPVFNAAIHDWPEHLEKLSAFWSSVMLTSGRYKGSPMAAHLRHAGSMKPEMFTRWLELWQETARETLHARAADAVVAKAERIAESLQLALYFNLEKHRGAVAA
jgi:hemoglobin